MSSCFMFFFFSSHFSFLRVKVTGCGVICSEQPKLTFRSLFSPLTFFLAFTGVSSSSSNLYFFFFSSRKRGGGGFILDHIFHLINSCISLNVKKSIEFNEERHIKVLSVASYGSDLLMMTSRGTTVLECAVVIISFSLCPGTPAQART